MKPLRRSRNGAGKTKSRSPELLARYIRENGGRVATDIEDKVDYVVVGESPEDAFVLARHTTPQLTEHDLTNLDAYQAAVRLVVAGQDTPAFTLRTMAPVAA